MMNTKAVLIDAILNLKPYAESFGFDYPCLSPGVETEREELGYYTSEELAPFLVEMAEFIKAAVDENYTAEVYDKWVA